MHYVVCMKALVLLENGKLSYGEAQMPARPKPGWCLVRVVACGICGSDLHRAFDNGAYHYPLIMGHEFSAVVEEAGAGADYARGQRVAVFPLVPCHACAACQTGRYAQCSDYDYLGSRRDGAFAEYVYAPAENLFEIPDQVDSLHAAMTEPCAVALHAVRKPTIEGGETAVVYGAGPIGNMVAQWLRIRGCRQVMVVDIDRRKLKIAEDIGFPAIDASEGDPVATVLQHTHQTGVDVAVEACGLPLTYRQSVLSVGTSGQVVLLGNIAGELSLAEEEVSTALRKELILYGTWNSSITPRDRNDWSTVLQYLDQGLEVAPLISHTPPLSEGVEVFGRLHAGQEHFNKVVFRV